MAEKNQLVIESSALDEVFKALAAHAPLRDCIVYKGARVLNARLGTNRQSLDLDGNLTQRFTSSLPELDEQKRFLDANIRAAIEKHFQRQPIVRYSLSALTVTRQPKQNHAFGWDGFKIKAQVTDSHLPGVPLSLAIDITAPEELTENAIEDLHVDGQIVQAYSLKRIAGEKLRAFLSSLPAYRAKIRQPAMDIRAKDLYDLHRIQAAYPLADQLFWAEVANDFMLACRSRFIDCHGMNTFKEDWEVTRKSYVADPRLIDISIEEAEHALDAVVRHFESINVIPFENPLPRP